ncbi:hypothetical protein CgunFtcFv8_008041 [Champsocephalus gunnari]|uniref:Uncharacterized protein n=1 Tax=Champsocephalus gunnari TaxID=52237 RepID=A0AAN8D4D8_CHAGU|nr:hypothetical protein CgunFtcFv8_008041 [Champsocephalus gunnari]
MNSVMVGDQRLTHHGQHCQSKSKSGKRRTLHQSTLDLGDTAPCYTTTHSQSYSGESAGGRPLIFHLRDPSFPSQHRNRLDLSTALQGPLQGPLQSHSADVHGPKHITPRTDQRKENWARYRSGQAIREITNPQPTESWSSYRAGHTLRAPEEPCLPAGRATQWHQHNLLTGEPRQQAGGPGGPFRRRRDELLWVARPRETDCTALRLY